MWSATETIGGKQHEHQPYLPPRGRLSDSRPAAAGGAANRGVGYKAETVLAAIPRRHLHRDAPQREVERPSGGDRPGGQ